MLPGPLRRDNPTAFHQSVRRGKISSMDRNSIIERLRLHRGRFRKRGIVRLSLFGSAALDKADSDSDVDIAVQLGEAFSDGGFDYFAKFETLRRDIANLLGRKVDLVEEPVARGSIQARIEKDRVIAFE